MLDEVFTFPYETHNINDSFIYDLVSTEKDGSTKINVVVPGYSKEDLSYGQI
jgi:HSP20 family molecular chaperone IbpA